MANEWQMSRRSDHCRVCNRAFEVNEALGVLLHETEAGYERFDHCLTCEPPTKLQPIARWRTRRPAPETRRSNRIDTPALFAFFKRLGEHEAPEGLQFRFVLALLLWRKKVLTLEDSQVTDGVEVWRFRVPKQDEQFDVQRPALNEERIDRLSSQLETLLQEADADLEALIELDQDSETAPTGEPEERSA